MNIMADLILPKGVFRWGHPECAAAAARRLNLPLSKSLPSGKGVSAIDAAPAREGLGFPYGLGAGGVHEICAEAYGDGPASIGFALAALRAEGGAPPQGVVIWITDRRMSLDEGRLLEAGLGAIGAGGLSILHVAAARARDALWAIEEAVTARAARLVIGAVNDLDFTASRRLSLASTRCGTPVALLLAHGRTGTSAAAARWRVASQGSGDNLFDAHAPGNVRWRASLERCRAAPHLAGREFMVEVDRETLFVRVVAGLAADLPPARAAGGINTFKERYRPRLDAEAV